MSEEETINDGGPAFPVASHSGPPSGLSMRDYFAGQVLAGLNVINSVSFFEATADVAYKQADAMIERRSQ